MNISKTEFNKDKDIDININISKKELGKDEDLKKIKLDTSKVFSVLRSVLVYGLGFWVRHRRCN
ncbi:MAG: hypothetical protein QNJ60_09275 [Xenococcaceae cyanobacterium MO_188.B19]|nr:hypothetical protein [Xenococcaceae cyanobacterium MO_188.B19]